MGTPFMLAGEEFARTKKGLHNSYRSPASINQLSWSRASRFHGLVDYYRGLIALRARFPRLGDGKLESAHAIEFFSLEPPLEGWHLEAADGDGAAWPEIAVFYNPTAQEATVPLPEGAGGCCATAFPPACGGAARSSAPAPPSCCPTARPSSGRCEGGKAQTQVTTNSKRLLHA